MGQGGGFEQNPWTPSGSATVKDVIVIAFIVVT